MKPASGISGYVPPLAWFLRRRVVSRPGARLCWQDLHRAFVAESWPAGTNAEHFGKALALLCRTHGVRVEVEGSRVFCADCELT